MSDNTAGSLFDRYVVVDWSARSSPATGADSIWIGELADGEIAVSNPATRRAAAEEIHDVLDRSRGERLLLGFDASLGYPAGTAGLLGLEGTPWEATWGLIAELSSDDAHNRNNRFELAAELNRRIGQMPGPFWGCPPSRATGHLAPTKPPGFELGEFRLTEQCLRERGLRPASCWQLLGIGSVGGQTLTLLPLLAELRARCPGRVDVWPFTTGLAVPDPSGGAAVIAELWPTMFPLDDSGPVVKDAAQVVSSARAVHQADLDGELARWLTPRLEPSEAARVVSEEGWVLGATADARQG